MKYLRLKTWCQGCEYLDADNECCELGIENRLYKKIGHRAWFAVVDVNGCKAARQNQLFGYAANNKKEIISKKRNGDA